MHLISKFKPLKNNYFNLLLSLMPLSFIAGNMIININIILLIISAFIIFGKNIFGLKFHLLDKLILSFFFLILITGIIMKPDLSKIFLNDGFEDKQQLTIDKMATDGTFDNISKNERLHITRDRAKLETNFGSIADLTRLPAAMFIFDISKEHIAVTEAQKLGIPTFAVVDTNSDPSLVDFAIPANDDASTSIDLIMTIITKAVAEGLSERKVDKEAMAESKAKKEVKAKVEEKEEEVAESATSEEEETKGK